MHPLHSLTYPARLPSSLSTKRGQLCANRSLPQDQPYLPDHELIWDPLNGIEVYDGFVEIEDCRFARFEDRFIPPIEPSWTVRRHAAGLTQVAKYSTWINDPRNRVRELSFRTDVDRRIWFRTPLDGQNQIAFTTIVDEDNSIGYGSGTDPMILFPNVPFLASGSNATFQQDFGSMGLNGYHISSADAQYGQLVVELIQGAGLDPEYTNWWRDLTPGGTPTLGSQWICETVPATGPLGGNGHYRFPVVIEVGDLGLPVADVRYYRMNYQGYPSNYPKDLNIALRFAPDVNKTVFVEIPYNGGGNPDGSPTTVKFLDEQRVPTDVLRYTSVSAFLDSGTNDREAWTFVSTSSPKKLILKITSLLDAALFLDPDGVQTIFIIRN